MIFWVMIRWKVVEGGGTVTILGWELERQHLVRAEVQHLGRGDVLSLARTVLERFAGSQ